MSVVAKLSEFLASNKNDFTRVSEEERQAYPRHSARRWASIPCSSRLSSSNWMAS